mmetsp:Transcript_48037/g.114152  ORF Transcript_48037/g.114152 Transcript_48037/m.114152 type:complete len:787 (-) Transcript_48037:155-2515(-)
MSSAASRIVQIEYRTPASSRRRSSAKPVVTADHHVEASDHLVLRLLQNADPEANVLKTWFEVFDHGHTLRTNYEKFAEGMKMLNFPGNALSLWHELDEEDCGELALEQLDSEAHHLWADFRRWCGSTFSGAKDMLRRLKKSCNNAVDFHVMDEDPVTSTMSMTMEDSPNSMTSLKSGWGNAARRRSITSPGGLDRYHLEELLLEDDFTLGLQRLGWTQGFEAVLFRALDADTERCLPVRALKWVEAEVRKFRRKEVSKRKANRLVQVKSQRKKACHQALHDFKEHLRKSYKSLFHAWRKVLDTDGTMTLQRTELVKACQALGWKGSVLHLWQGLDTDGSGSTSFEEFDAHTAQALAIFKRWAEAHWGSSPAPAMFKAMDKAGRRRLHYLQFVRGCNERGLTFKVDEVAVALDWQDKKYLIEDDFRVLDTWHPMAWLACQPSRDTADQFKSLLIAKFGNFVKAWRTALDKDNSNCCSWREFIDAARLLKFKGEIGAAWLALDEDLSGYITLKELDADAHHILVEFKRWTESEFGSIRNAFKVLDSDGSNELNFREFRAAVRDYGFDGDVKCLFQSLDQEYQGSLRFNEMAFLDDWEVDSVADDNPEDAAAKASAEAGQQSVLGQHPVAVGLEYHSPVPGPGTYEVMPSIGVCPSAPTMKSSAAWSIGIRRPCMLGNDSRGTGSQSLTIPSPTNYDPSLESTSDTKRKPAWTFGTTKRAVFSVKSSVAVTPGPGSYEVRPNCQSPRFTMGLRRGLRLHPRACVAAPCAPIIARPATSSPRSGRSKMLG